jgi:hypothetical protein
MSYSDLSIMTCADNVLATIYHLKQTDITKRDWNRI